MPSGVGVRVSLLPHYFSPQLPVAAENEVVLGRRFWQLYPMRSTIKEQWDIDGYVVLRSLLAGNTLDSAGLRT